MDPFDPTLQLPARRSPWKEEGATAADKRVHKSSYFHQPVANIMVNTIY